MILKKTYDLLKTKYSSVIANLTISDVRIRALLSAVILSYGSCGVAGNGIEANAHCGKHSRSLSPDARINVTGPSSSIIPDILFENNLKIIGATRIIDSDLLLSIVGEAGVGFHLFEYCA